MVTVWRLAGVATLLAVSCAKHEVNPEVRCRAVVEHARALGGGSDNPALEVQVCTVAFSEQRTSCQLAAESLDELHGCTRFALPPTPARPGTGTITVVTHPAGGQVTIAGDSPLAAPFQLRGIELGVHDVHATLAGYQDWTGQVTIEKDTKLEIRFVRSAP